MVLYHFQPTLYQASPSIRILEPVLSRGDLGVPLFFVLSGFIIWHNYGFHSLLSPRSTLRFLWRRFARLWPVNLVTTTLAVPLVYWAVKTQNYWGAPIPAWYSKLGWLKSAFMVSQIGQPEPVFAWNQPSWTLSGEMVAYVLFPIVLALVLVARTAHVRFPWVWMVAGLILATLVMDKNWLFPSRWLVELVLIFVVGVMVRLAGLPGGRILPVASFVQVAAPFAILVECYLNQGASLVALLAIWVWSLSSVRGPGVWLFSTRAAQFAGLSSYSVYMLHWVIFGYGYILLYYAPLAKKSFLWLFVVVTLILVAAASWFTWRFFETPARKLLNRLFEWLWPRRAKPGDAKSAEDVDVSQTEVIGVQDAHHVHHAGRSTGDG